MTGLFVGQDEDVLLTYRAEALADLGKVVTSYSDSGTSVSKTFGLTPEKRLMEINYALRLLDPGKYGKSHTSVQKTWTNRRDF